MPSSRDRQHLRRLRRMSDQIQQRFEFLRQSLVCSLGFWSGSNNACRLPDMLHACRLFGRNGRVTWRAILRTNCPHPVSKSHADYSSHRPSASPHATHPVTTVAVEPLSSPDPTRSVSVPSQCNRHAQTRRNYGEACRQVNAGTVRSYCRFKDECRYSLCPKSDRAIKPIGISTDRSSPKCDQSDPVPPQETTGSCLRQATQQQKLAGMATHDPGTDPRTEVESPGCARADRLLLVQSQPFHRMPQRAI